MSIYVVGINHKTAPISIREKIYFPPDKISLYLQDLLQCTAVHEAVLLSTCNRSEVYCHTDEIKTVCDWFYAQTTLPRAIIEPALYLYRDQDAIEHIMQVACGLDSMVLGEQQILGQMKEAFSESCAASCVGSFFHRLFQQIFKVAKEIRTTTAIGACPVSVAAAAVHFIKQKYPLFTKANVVLIGAGDMIELIVRYLKPHLIHPVTFINRNIENAGKLGADLPAQIYGLDCLHEVLYHADIVFSATSSPTPIIDKNMLEKIMSRKQSPMVCVDIAVPRDMDPSIAHISGVELYCIDDLKNIIENNRKGRWHAAIKAREMIRQKSEEFIAESKSLDKVNSTIRAYRSRIESICHAELTKAKAQLQRGVDPDKVLDTFAHAFTNKLLHEPSVQLRQAGEQGHFELLKFAEQLFAISDHETECI